MEKGIKFSLERVVTEDLTAKAMGSGTLDVFATPAMIALIEETAWKSVAERLEDGQATVGTCLKINHIAPSPVGMKIKCETELTEIDGRRLVFNVKVVDECGEIGNGVHERFIINAERFQAKANEKAK